MKQALIASLFAFGSFLGLGCNKSPEGGAPSGSNTFELKAPTMSTTIKQGETKNIDVTISHGKDFKDDIMLDAAGEGLPKGVETKLSKAKVPATEEKVTLAVTAASDATLGEGKVKVTGKPGTGNATSVNVPVKIEAK